MAKRCSKRTLRTFVLTYNVTVPVTKEYYKGCALIKADDEASAKSRFLADSMFNGCRKEIKIEKLREIYPSVEPMLLCEESVEQIKKQ